MVKSRIVKYFLLGICVCIGISSYGQYAGKSSRSYYESGLSYYNQGQYAQAREQFETYLRSGSDDINQGDAAYYRAMSALKLFNNDGEFLMDKFLRDYPMHSKASLAYFNVGNYFYQSGDYKGALTNFKKAKVPPKYSDEYNFKKGYSYFNLRQAPDAKQCFLKVQSFSEFQAPSNYYLGYIYFQEENYDSAEIALEPTLSEPSYANSSAIMMANIYLEQKKFKKCINFIKALPESAVDDKLQYALGRAYLKTNNYKLSAQAFEKGLDMSNRKAEATVYFNFAEALRLDGQKEKAIEFYSFAALDEDEIGHHSSYYLGMLYVEDDNLEFARTAFWKSLKSKDPVFREESIFQLINVEFELENYKECIEGVKRYKRSYPEGKYTTKANELLTEAFLNTSDYELAISYIERLDQLSDPLKATYQKVTYLKGAESFNNSQFGNAVNYFDKSLQYNVDKTYNVLSYYYKGECYSVAEKWQDAIGYYKSALYVSDTDQKSSEAKAKSRYGLAYAYFNQKDYEAAIQNFKSFLNTSGPNARMYIDARVRLADCYYVSKNYAEAEKIYVNTLKQAGSPGDYIQFQLGVLNALQDKDDLAAEKFRAVISTYPNSNFRDNAIYQLAEMQFENTDYEMAIGNFNQLIDDYPQSQLLPHAYLKKAISYYNLKDYQKTIENYKSILEQYINHKTANGALLGLQEVYAITGESGDFEKYLNLYKQAHPDDESLEYIEFEAAKSVYYNQQYEKAIGALIDFRSKYTQSSFLDEAHYLIGESYFRNGQNNEAIEAHQEVLSFSSSKYRNRSLARIGELLARQDPGRSLRYFGELYKISSNRRDKSNALSGLMNAHFELNHNDSALYYATIIQESDGVTNDARSDATLLIGKIYLQQKQYDLAADNFIQLLNGIKDEKSAEAKFRLGEVYYHQGKYQQSLDNLFQLSKSYAIYEYWIGRSFILIAENYIALEELFQAKATLNSIIEKSPNQEIVERATKLLATIDKKESEVIEKVEEDSVSVPNE